MDWYNRKHVTNLIMGVLVALLAAGTYLLYIYYRSEHLADYKMQDTYANPKRTDSATPPDMRAIVQREIDSIKKATGGDAQPSFDIQVKPDVKQADSVNLKQVILHKKDSVASSNIRKTEDGVLQAPDAVFSRDYTIGIGKTVPVNIVWEDAGAKKATYRLITIKTDDILDKRAKFTIEDPFNVLLFSQTGYGAKDKILIEDSKHNITISVLQVNENSVVVNLTSHLDESIVSRLQKIQ